MSLARRLWARYEPLHDVLYFSPYVREAASALGLKGYWMGYFAFRAAPLGRVVPAAVTAAFYGFAARRVERALPDAWRFTTPERALAARAEAAGRALHEAFGPDLDVREAAEMLWEASRAADVAGRPLAAANQALPQPDDPVAALWQATTVLREHRGDGHNAVLVARGIGPVAAHLFKVAADESDADMLKVGRGFTDDEWQEGRESLIRRGWLDDAGRLTAEGVAEHRAVEEQTDRIAAGPWEAVGPQRAEQALRALEPLRDAVAATGLIPTPGAVGVVETLR
jgi:hypothetical protein